MYLCAYLPLLQYLQTIRGNNMHILVAILSVYLKRNCAAMHNTRDDIFFFIRKLQLDSLFLAYTITVFLIVVVIGTGKFSTHFNIVQYSADHIGIYIFK